MALTENFIATNRFGLGPMPGQTGRIATGGRAWASLLLDQDIEPYADGTPETGGLVSLLKELSGFKKEAKDNKSGQAAEAAASMMEFRKETREILLKALMARFVRNVTSDNPLHERLTLFWSNHFTVSMRNKPAISVLMPAFERDAIRPHILGRFEDLLLAAEQHPAMLLYLDNAQSVGPNSQAGQRRKVGLNENLGREIMELHTLGVNGGYTQTDVTTLAKIITGWTIDPPAHGGTGNFIFQPRIHEPGPQTLLGKTYGQQGVAQGVAALRDIAHHPSTARFIATKLVRHFVNDNPDEGDVQTVAGVFQESGGDLREVMRAVIGLSSVWAQPLPKVKTPYELIVSTFRGLGIDPNRLDVKHLMGALDLMDHRPFNAPSPAGWPDKADDWISSAAIMNRVEWAHALSQKIAAAYDPLAVAKDITGPVAGADTLAAISRAPSGVDGLALLLSSPEFQRR